MIPNNFQNGVMSLLSKCRPGDDKHASRVVKWVEILAGDNPFYDRLVKAAYVHDLGWYSLMDTNKKLTKDELKRFESKANRQSKLIITNFLKQQNEPENEIREILKLVSAADSHQSHNSDEAIIVDADNLSKLTIDHVSEKYQKSDWQKMLTLWQEEFPKRIQTDKGKSLYPCCLMS